MATVNISKQFKSLLPTTTRFRAEVIVVNEALNKVKVQWGASSIWVTAISGLAINEQVLIEGDKVVSKLPSLDYARIEI